MSMLESYSSSNTIYLSIVGGKLAQKVKEDTPGATKREYELKDGVKGVKYELYFKSVSGVISGLEFREGDYGEQFIVTITNEGKDVKISMPSSSNFFTDFAKKLPNISIIKEITLNVFDFEGEKGNRIRGFTIYQEGAKAANFYYDIEAKKTLNGFPEVDKKEAKTYDKDDWKVFFLKVKKFLKLQVVEQSKDIVKVDYVETIKGDEKMGEEISVEDLPF